jgi:hypothetical protein
MKFVLVNGGRPKPRSFCAICFKPVGESYLRELATGLYYYCDHNCYFAGNSKIAVPALQYQTRA